MADLILSHCLWMAVLFHLLSPLQNRDWLTSRSWIDGHEASESGSWTWNGPMIDSAVPIPLGSDLGATVVHKLVVFAVQADVQK